MKLRKLAAGGLCAVLAMSAAPLTVFAAEEPSAEEVTADWIPQNFTDAYNFHEEYGSTHTEGDLACLVRLTNDADTAAEPLFCEASEGSGLIETRVCQLELPEEPKEEDFESHQDYRDAYRAYEDALHALGLSTRDGEETMGALKWFSSVSVIRLLPEGTASVRFSEKSKNTYTFAADAEGKVTETDIYGWLPDCYSEYRSYQQEHPDFSLHDDLILYCGTTNGSTGYVLDISQNGSAKLERILTSGCSPTLLAPFIAGNSSFFIDVYRPVTAGTVQLSAKSYQPWSPSEEHSNTKTVYYQVTDEGVSVTEATEFADLPGDCNADGTVSIADLVMMQKWLLCDGELTSWRNADLSGDGRVNAIDMALLSRKLTQAEQFAEITLNGLPSGLPHSTGRLLTAQAEVKLCEGVTLSEDEELVVMLCYQNQPGKPEAPVQKDIIVMKDSGSAADGDETAGDGIWSCQILVETNNSAGLDFVAYAAVRKTGGLAEIRACSPVWVIGIEFPGGSE